VVPGPLSAAALVGVRVKRFERFLRGPESFILLCVVLKGLFDFFSKLGSAGLGLLIGFFPPA